MTMRTNYLIKKKFQLRFALSFAILILLEAALTAGLFMYISNDTITTGYMDSILTIERTPNFFVVPFSLIMIIAGVGIALAGMVTFVLLSHKIAGPLYRFEQDLNEIANGNLTKRISVRRSDQLTEFKDALNELTESLDQRISLIKARFAELKALSLKKDDPESIAKIRSSIERLESELDRFRVSQGPR